MINYGSGQIPTALIKVLELTKAGMRITMTQLFIMCLIFLTLNIIYEIFLANIQGDLSKVLTEIANEMLYIIFFMFLLYNWLNGIKILENIIEPIVFEKIPSAIFHFKIGNTGTYLYTNDGHGALLNLDETWRNLNEIPNKIIEKSGIYLLTIAWLIQSMLGFFISYIALKLLVYIIIVLMFADILKSILEMHLLFIFSGIMFPFMTLKFLRNNYGLSILKTILLTTIQYYFLFLLINFMNGYFAWILSKGGPIIALVALFFMNSTFKNLMKNMKIIGERM